MSWIATYTTGSPLADVFLGMAIGVCVACTTLLALEGLGNLAAMLVDHTFGRRQSELMVARIAQLESKIGELGAPINEGRT